MSFTAACEVMPERETNHARKSNKHASRTKQATIVSKPVSSIAGRKNRWRTVTRHSFCGVPLLVACLSYAKLYSGQAASCSLPAVGRRGEPSIMANPEDFLSGFGAF